MKRLLAGGAAFLALPLASQPSNAALQGDYVAVTYFDDAVDGRSTSLADLRMDGNGSGSWTVTASSIGDTGAGALTYAVDAGGALTMAVDGSALRGITTASGAMLTAVELEPGAFGIHTALRTSSGLTNADLAGDFGVVQYFDDATDGLSTAFSVVTFDGAGGGTFDVQIHTLGETGAGPFTYSLDGEGRLTLLADGSTLTGAYNPDADALVLVETEPEAFGVYLGVAASSGNTAATLAGAYGFARYESENAEALADYSALTFDGAGGATLQTLQSSDGGVGTEPLTYAVDADGTFSVPEAGTSRGVVDAGGRWLVFAQLGPAQLGIAMGIREAGAGTAAEGGGAAADGPTLAVGPHPSRGAVVVRVGLVRAASVRVEAFDLLGRRVAVLDDAERPAGVHRIPWDAAPGRYLIRLSAGGQTRVRPSLVY